jgi:hypothetical protein
MVPAAGAPEPSSGPDTALSLAAEDLVDVV